MSSSSLQTPYVSTEELSALWAELQDKSQCKRGDNGFERPLYVSPLTWDQVKAVVAELLARRKVK